MNYWLCITNEENWNVVKAKNIWGVPERHRNTILKVKKGDKLLMYLKQEKINDELKESRITGSLRQTQKFSRTAQRYSKS
jgi:predicted RNA-binding protein